MTIQPFAWAAPGAISQAMAAETTTVADAMIAPAGAPPRNVGVYKAGGVDLLDLLKEEILAPTRIVSLSGAQELRTGINDDGQRGVRIGALTTLAEIGENRVLRERYPAFAGAAGGSASPQLRNVATLGGNLAQRPRCWYFRSAHHHCRKKGGNVCFAHGGENQYLGIFDNEACAIVHPSTGATALVAYGATIELIGPEGRRDVTIEQFLVSPSADVRRENVLRPREVVAAVRLPPVTGATRAAHLRQNEKQEFDWPIADVAVVLDAPGGTVRRAAVVLGAAAPVPWRARAAEATLTGRRVTPQLAATASAAALEGARPLSKNGYKVQVFRALVERAILQAARA